MYSAHHKVGLLLRIFDGIIDARFFAIRYGGL